MKNLFNKFFDKQVETIVIENIDKYNSKNNDLIETMIKQNIEKYKNENNDTELIKSRNIFQNIVSELKKDFNLIKDKIESFESKINNEIKKDINIIRDKILNLEKSIEGKINNNKIVKEIKDDIKIIRRDIDILKNTYYTGDILLNYSYLNNNDTKNIFGFKISNNFKYDLSEYSSIIINPAFNDIIQIDWENYPSNIPSFIVTEEDDKNKNLSFKLDKIYYNFKKKKFNGFLGLNTNDLYFTEDLNGYGNQSITQRFSYSYDNLLTNLGMGGKYINGNTKIYGTFYVSRDHLFDKDNEIGKLITSSILYNGFYNTNLFFSVKHNISNYPNGLPLYTTKELRKKIEDEAHSRTSISLGLDKIFKKFKLHFLINNGFIKRS